MNRRLARILVVQALCHDDVQGGGALEALESLSDDADADTGTKRFAETLCRAFVENHESIDVMIGTALEKWDISRVEPIGKSVLRAASAEMAHCDTPVKVILNEAIEIAREFSTDEAAKFVNGVLEGVRRQLGKAS